MNKGLLKSKRFVENYYRDSLGIESIVEVKNITELVKAIEKECPVWQDFLDNLPLIEIHKIAKEMYSDPKAGKRWYEYVEKLQRIALLNGPVNGIAVENSVSYKYRKQVTPLRKKLITENRIDSTSELLVLDMAINAYFRSLHSSQIYSHLIEDKDGSINYSQFKINMMKELGKQIETANRQFLSALTLLKEMKQPPININVQSKQAFVGQNQQFNKNA